MVFELAEWYRLAALELRELKVSSGEYLIALVEKDQNS